MTVEAESPGAQPGDGTAAGMIAWLGWTISSGELVEATASALRTGCLKVLAVESDPTSVDIKNADIDNIVLRFRNKLRGSMKDQTINTYDQRFRQTVDMYCKWLADDQSWRPATRNRGTGTSVARKAEKRAVPAPAVPKPEVGASGASEAPTGPHLLQYPFPIRPGVQGKITLPEDLTAKEARRIANFVASLAIEEEEFVRPSLELTTGAPVEGVVFDE